MLEIWINIKEIFNELIIAYVLMCLNITSHSSVIQKSFISHSSNWNSLHSEALAPQIVSVRSPPLNTMHSMAYCTSGLKARDSNCCFICREYRCSFCDSLKYKAEDMDSMLEPLKPPKTKEKRGQPVVSGPTNDDNGDLDMCSTSWNTTNESRRLRRSWSLWNKRH